MFSFLAVTSLLSCDDDTEELFTTAPNSDIAFTSTPASSYILTFETKDNTAERFVWTPLEFTTPIAVTYELQASTDASNFDNAVPVTATSDTSTSLTVEQMNDLAAQLGLTPFSSNGIAMRVMASSADASMGTNVSDVIILSVTPYTTESPKLWVPGNYAEDSGYGPNWAPDNDATPYLEAVEFGSTQFEGFIYMNVAAPEFKITPEMNWDNAYGDAGSGLISLTASDNLTVPGPGFYYITVDTDPDGDPATDDATFTASVRDWGIIGAATLPSNPAEWSDELDMTYNQDTKKWSVELDMAVGEFKFRAQQWDPATYNFGVSDEGLNVLSFGGGNLSQAAAGRYRAEIDLSVPRNYTFELISI